MSAVMEIHNKKSESISNNVEAINALCIITDKPCVFIVDDDDAVRDGLELVIETLGIDCRTFDSAEKFLASYRHGMTGCLVLDYSLPGLNGLQLQDELNIRKILLPIIFLTAHGDAPMADRAMKAGAFGFLMKPVQIELLLEKIQAAVKHGG